MKYLISLILLLSLNLNAQVGPLPNGGLEKGLEGWGLSGTGLAVIDLGRNTEGKQSLRMSTGMNSSGAYILSPTFNFNDFRTGTCVGTFDHIVWASGQSTNFYATLTDGSGAELNTAWRQTVVAHPTEAVATYKFIFPCRPDVRFSFVSNGTGNANNNIDNVKFEVAKDVEVANVTSWKEIAAVAGTHIKAVTTNPTFGTVTVNKLLYRVVGNALEVEWSYNQTTGGSAGSGMYLIDVSGLGYTFDLSKLSHNTSGGPTGSTVGSIYSWDAASAGQGQSGMCYMYDATKIKCIGVQAQGSSGIAGNSTWPTSINFSTSNYNVGVHLTIPIIGQTNSTVINAECPDQYACVDTFTATVSDAGVISNANIAGWINNFSVSDTSLFTGNFKSGLFSQKPVCVATINAGDDTTVYDVKLIDASTNSSTIVYRTGYATSTKYAYRTNISCTRSGSDFKGKRVLQAEISPLYYFEGTVTTTSANNPIGVATVVEDQWGNWDNTNKRYTAKEGGIYEVSMGLSSIDINTTIVVWKNGVTTNKRVLYISSDGTQSTATLRLNANEYIDVRPTTSPVLTNGFLYIKRLGK